MSDWWTGAPVVSPAPSPRSVARQPQARRQAAPRYSGPMPTGADEVFSSLIAQESGGRAGVRGPQTQYGQALGRTQVLPDTARGIARNLGIPYREDLLTGTSPEAASYQDQLGRAYLQEGFQNTGNARDALMYYHGGPNRDLWGPKTNAYADEVLTRWNQGGGVPATDNMADMPSQSGSEWWASAPVVDPAAATAPETAQKPAWDGPTTDIKDGVWVQGTGGENDWQFMSRERANRLEDPEYQRAFADAQRGSENVPDQLRALGLGASYGFLTDINAEAQRVIQGAENIGRRATGQEVRYGADDLAQATRDAMRDDQAAYAAAKPLENFALQLAGGVVAPGAIQGGQFIGTGAGATGRAAAVGGAMGAASGIGYGQGNLIERAPDAAIGGLTGAGTGAIIQGGLNRLAAPGQGGGAARALSRQGVDLTPAQMMSDVPMLGPVARWTEQAGSSIPIAGLAMRGAERRSVESFDRAAINDALSSIGATVPRRTSGREAIRFGDDALSARYQADLNPVTIQPDPQINARIVAALNPRNLSRTARTTLNDTAADVVARIQNPISGPEWKQIDSELSALINTTANGDAASRPLSRALRDVREVWGDALDQASPGTLARVREADDAYGNFQLIRKAASNPTTGRNDELFTPSNLNSVLARSEGRAYGRGEARLQNLVDPAERVMAGTLNNSGTPERAAIATVALGGAATGAIVNPAVAIPTIVGVSALYSRPAQAALNAVYRATDSRAANAALRQLADQARRNPSLLPYYEDAVQHALSLSQRDTQAAPPAQPSAQAPSPALQRVLQ